MIFAKLNPGIRYVQGMNEVLAPIFYVFKNDPDLNNAVFCVFISQVANCQLPPKIATFVCSCCFTTCHADSVN
jgi:Rab-GTPase-TBC domain